MRFHLLMFIIVILVSLGMHGLATAAPRIGGGPTLKVISPADA